VFCLNNLALPRRQSINFDWLFFQKFSNEKNFENFLLEKVAYFQPIEFEDN